MKSTVETVEDSRVKLSVEVDEDEFQEAIDEAFKKIAKQVRIPGFRAGKAPRKVVEAQIGLQAGRSQALEDSIPDYYLEAVRENEVDVISPPDFEITGGETEGPLSFDAIVEVRPSITVPGYAGLRVEIPNPQITDEEVTEVIDRMRKQQVEYETAERAATDDDQVLMDIETHQGDEEIEGLTAEDYLYEVGSEAVVKEIDENLRGAKAGDVLEFDAAHPDEDEDDLSIKISVKEVQGNVLPELTDEWVQEQEGMEYETVEEMRTELTEQMTRSRIAQANYALREEAEKSLAELVDDEIPESLINGELQDQLEQLAMQLQSQGIDPSMYFNAVPPEQLREQHMEGAERAARVDLALRSVADAESIEVEDSDITEAIEPLAEQTGQSVEEIRDQIERSGRLPAVRSDLRKSKALDWLIEQVEIVDTDGNPIDRADLEQPETPEDTEEAADDSAASVEEASAETDAESAEGEASE